MPQPPVGQTVLQGAYEVVVEEHGFVVAAVLGSHLGVNRALVPRRR